MGASATTDAAGSGSAQFPLRFIAVGPQRTATTWLHRVLEGRVALPEGVKEPMFFDRHYARGLDWYRAHFRRYRDKAVFGEIAPTYFHSAQARQRIKRHIPDCRIICTLRDPVIRLYSMYRLMSEYGTTRAPFEAAIHERPEMLESSRYSLHVKAWQELFGMDRVLVLLNDDLVIDPQAYMDGICDFIGIQRFKLGELQKQPTEKEAAARFYHLTRAGQAMADWMRGHRLYGPINFAKRLGLRKFFVGGGQELPPMSAATAAELRAYFMSEVESLEKLLHRNLDAWKKPKREPSDGWRAPASSPS